MDIGRMKRMAAVTRKSMAAMMRRSMATRALADMH
jgi:hypothetical protein